MTNDIPSVFLEDKRFNGMSRSVMLRLVSVPASRITESGMGHLSVEEQVIMYQLARNVLSDRRYEKYWVRVAALANRLQDFITKQHMSLLGRCAYEFYKRFADIATEGEFFSAAYSGLDKALSSYKSERGRSRVGGSKITNWFGFQIKLRLQDFVYEKGGSHKLHTRHYKFRAYFSGKYDNSPEYKMAFELTNNLQTDDLRNKARLKYASLVGLSSLSLDDVVSRHFSSEPLTLGDTISDVGQFRRGAIGVSDAFLCSASGMDHNAIISDFEQECDPGDYEIWRMIRGGEYSQPDIVEKTGLTKSEVSNAMRRAERAREKYANKVLEDDLKLSL